jgi:hypothetical protein
VAGSLDFTVGIIEVNYPRGKFSHIGEVIFDFSKDGIGGGLTYENGDGHYNVVMPGMPLEWCKKCGRIEDTNPTAYGFFETKGNTVEIKTPPSESNETRRYINAAINLREKFLKYLEKEKIPHKVLLLLFDD